MSDPHIHVEQQVVQAGASVRSLLASSFGLVADAPSEVTTGCGLRVPYAMTSPRPESVTCLACREHGHREHRRFAEQIEHLIGPGMPVSGEDVTRAAQHHRDLAERFA
jgi:hypothetical protein